MGGTGLTLIVLGLKNQPCKFLTDLDSNDWQNDMCYISFYSLWSYTWKSIWKARTDLLPLQQPIMWTHLFRESTTMNPFSPWLYPLLLQKQHDARHLGPTWRFASSHWLQPDPLALHLRACRPYANQDKTGSNHAVKCTQNHYMHFLAQLTREMIALVSSHDPQLFQTINSMFCAQIMFCSSVNDPTLLWWQTVPFFETLPVTINSLNGSSFSQQISIGVWLRAWFSNLQWLVNFLTGVRKGWVWFRPRCGSADARHGKMSVSSV